MKLLIAIPTLDFMHYRFVESLTKLICKLSEDGIDYKVEFKSGTLVYHAREKLAIMAWQEGFTHVLWFDADMVFTEDIFDDLSFHDKDFVSGICHGRRPPHSSCLFSSIEPIQRLSLAEYPDRLFSVAASGFGCVLMKTEVLLAVKEKFGVCFMPTAALGEDLAFCNRATQCGYTLWADPAVRLGHIGHIEIWPEDEQKWAEGLHHY